MTKRIFRSLFLVSALVALCASALIMLVLYRYFDDLERRQLWSQAELAAQGVEHEGLGYFEGLHTEHYRLTWVDAEGKVLYDSQSDAATMESHAEREEIQEALSMGSGESERYSNTLAQTTIYRAERLKDGTVLRISVTRATVWALLWGMLRPMALVLLLALLLTLFLAYRLSRRIVRPLNELNLDAPLENDTYEELSPLLNRIEHQKERITAQLEVLRRRQDEFSAVIHNMEEGLMLLNAQGHIVSVNPAAMRLFNAEEDVVGRDAVEVCRAPQLQALFHAALEGRRGELLWSHGGREYQLDASPVWSEGCVTGMVLLAFDHTERALAEQRRREFTANVSHELKTPLHSIMGSAELLENGLVKPEDWGRFAGRIHGEAARLVTLIDDIIRLSQLDEGGAMDMNETVSLRALAEELRATLAPAAQEAGVTVELRGDERSVQGSRRLLYEMLYNLCDNAIKYNRRGGHVCVEWGADEEGETLLSVSDTGLGIGLEHQERVFERFYRVDKSRSKATGGTGLGLSIVKHAAACHGARVALESELNHGTVVRVRFSRKQEEKV